ncbi:hypothetical protein MGG_16619 [Pyricularia oryzae 70-15]|uniref:Uncharacterized protein n=1 Tax=Pyricularia oryzae (strain 70-15 / ATCC MYA-4617 / FGSC 8958) TaxID=242507 RepID=G4N0P6_PYRO7|nr:uncharacterized protein MGG_16619 [Pyricularia oryzae 70-15]EHA51479.1 hypothetical protein MGG_16619 [Pyricularia oryzae 70-15]
MQISTLFSTAATMAVFMPNTVLAGGKNGLKDCQVSLTATSEARRSFWDTQYADYNDDVEISAGRHKFVIHVEQDCGGSKVSGTIPPHHLVILSPMSGGGRRTIINSAGEVRLAAT